MRAPLLPTPRQRCTDGFNLTGASAAEIAAEVAHTRSECIGFIVCGVVLLFFAFVVATPPVRNRVHAWLCQLGAAGEAGRAAGVAALVGGMEPQHVLVLARKRFMGLPYSALSAADFSSNADSGLNAKTRRVRLGEVDCFISHSWHDDAHEKWQVFSSWVSWGLNRLSPITCNRKVHLVLSRFLTLVCACMHSLPQAARFTETSGREPMLWFDKACILQGGNIEEQLACLPIFLSGCQRLLILAGPTWVERLWCTMELFTFMRMGGSAVSPSPLYSSLYFVRLNALFRCGVSQPPCAHDGCSSPPPGPRRSTSRL